MALRDLFDSAWARPRQFHARRIIVCRSWYPDKRRQRTGKIFETGYDYIDTHKGKNSPLNQYGAPIHSQAVNLGLFQQPGPTKGKSTRCTETANQTHWGAKMVANSPPWANSRNLGMNKWVWILRFGDRLMGEFRFSWKGPTIRVGREIPHTGSGEEPHGSRRKTTPRW